MPKLLFGGWASIRKVNQARSLMVAAGYRGWIAMGYSLVIGAAGLTINFVLAFMAFRMIMRLDQPLAGVEVSGQPDATAEPEPAGHPAQA